MRHNVLDRPDPHKVDDKARLLAQIEMDEEIERLRKKKREELNKQVLPKPNNLQPQVDKKAAASPSSSTAAPRSSMHSPNARAQRPP